MTALLEDGCAEYVVADADWLARVLAVQLARELGAGIVIATAGSRAKLDFLKELGADVAVDHTQPGWAGQVRAAAETVLPLAEVVQAHRLLEDRAVLGRLLLVP